MPSPLRNRCMSWSLNIAVVIIILMIFYFFYVRVLSSRLILNSTKSSATFAVRASESQVGRLLQSMGRSQCRKLHEQESDVLALQQKNTSEVKEYLANHMDRLPNAYITVIPEHTCPDEERVGSRFDGGKWLCGINRLLPKRHCIVYSFGSNGQDDFERHLRQLAPQCEIHTFDPGNFSLKVAGFITYHQMGLSAYKREVNGVPYLPLWDIVQRLGHDHVDVLKMDIEGGEHEVLPALYAAAPAPTAAPRVPVFQMQVEVHHSVPAQVTAHETFNSITRLLRSVGMVLFHMEINPYYVNGVELAFLNASQIFPKHLCKAGYRSIRGVHPPT